MKNNFIESGHSTGKSVKTFQVLKHEIEQPLAETNHDFKELRGYKKRCKVCGLTVEEVAFDLFTAYFENENTGEYKQGDYDEYTCSGVVGVPYGEFKPVIDLTIEDLLH